MSAVDRKLKVEHYATENSQLRQGIGILTRLNSELESDNASLTVENERLRKALESLKATDRFDPYVMTFLVPMIDAVLRGEE